jgi:hypothetical protein
MLFIVHDEIIGQPASVGRELYEHPVVTFHAEPGGQLLPICLPPLPNSLLMVMTYLSIVTSRVN